MRSIEAEIEIRGTPEQVWAVLTGFSDYPNWNPFIRQAAGIPSEGARLSVRIQPPDGAAMSFRPTVKVAAPGRELLWLGHFLVPGLFDGEHQFKIEALNPVNVRFTQTEIFRGLLVHLVPKSIYEKTEAGFAAMNRALKERVETHR
ncbi:MAG: SRPBCC domain-containing protein [Desulfofustis sp.]|nr:SRPBCC domain-containing protein [Desulfofustis sp.]